MPDDRMVRAMELVQQLERLLDAQKDPRVRMAEAMVRALRSELEGILRREKAA